MFPKFTGSLAGLAFAAAVISGCRGGGSGPSPTLGRSSTPAPALATPTYPFGSRHDAYTAGIRVSGTTDQMNTAIGNWYTSWANTRLVAVGTDQMYDRFTDSETGRCQTVSEGMGYALLITVVMAGGPHGDANAQDKFDKLLKFVTNHPATSIDASFTFEDGGSQFPARNYLMDWCVGGTGTDGWNAVDGDLDIALALLMADRQWGSSGTWNYKQRGVRTIKAIKRFNMDAAGNVLSKGLAFPGTTRSSDLMIGHFRAFKQATGDALWDAAVDRAFHQISRMQTFTQQAGAPAGTLTGLMPDWIENSDNDAQSHPWSSAPPEGNAYVGIYGPNAQRDPLRFAADYVFSNDQRWVGSSGALTRIAQFFSTKWPNSSPQTPNSAPPHRTGIYNLNGTMALDYMSQGMAGAVMASATLGPQYQPLMDNTWNWIVNVAPTSGYYESELALLSMFVVSGNWWLPTATNTCTVNCNPDPPPPTPLHVEAETSTVQGTGVSVRSDLAGYTGTGFVGDFHSAGDSLTLSFTGVTAGTYDVKIRYHAWTAQQNNVTINGTVRSVPFPASTPTTSDWVVATIPGVSLPTGTTTVVISKDWGFIDIDYVELVAGGAGSSPTKVQAESGAVQGTGVTVRSDLAGYEGTGFVGDFHNAGDSLTVNFTGLAAGTYTLTIRYHAWTAQQNNVIVNGSSRSVQFPASTPTTSDWVTVQVPNVTMTSGTNTVVIRKDWGFIDVDWLQVTQ